MPQFTHADKPLTLRGLTLKNRIFRSAHGTAIGGGGFPDRLIAYYVARAKGGVALSFMELTSLHPSSPSFNRPFDQPETADGYRRLVDAVRPHGMHLFQQLWHGGHNAPAPPEDGVRWSASDMPSPYWNGTPPIVMTKAMIDEVVGSFGAAAARLESWGISGAEIHAGHNYLVQQFLMRGTNRRTDEYGGSIENRTRFLIEILESVRANVGPDFVLGIRLADSLSDARADDDDLAAVVRLLQDRGLIDFVNLSHAGYYRPDHNIGGMDKPFGYQLPYSPQVRSAATVPVLVIGRFRTMEEADQVIRAGEADMVGMTRATIADPDLVVKSLNGRIEDVRPCIACVQDCLGRAMIGLPMGCAVNPAVGQELELGEDALAIAETPRRIVVVGGGPAGMEAARTAALRGHKVILFEAQPALGGNLKIAARAPTRDSFNDIIVWLESEVYRLGVDVRLSSYADADDIIREEADAVIIATGSRPRMDGFLAISPSTPIEGVDSSRVTSSEDVFLAPLPSDAKTAVVIDDTGHYEAIAVTERLLSLGLSVSLITRHISFAPLLEPTFQNDAHLRRLSRHGGFSFHARMRATAIEGNRVVGVPSYEEFSSNMKTEFPADIVTIVTANTSNNELHQDLQQRGVSSSLIGDALSARFLGDAMRDARRIAATV